MESKTETSTTVDVSLCVIVMATPSMGIGNNGSVPWVIPTEVIRTQQLTAIAAPLRSNAIILGSNTYLKLPEPRTFAGRKVCVLTSNDNFVDDNFINDDVVVATNVPDAMNKLLAADKNLERVFVLGGRTAFMEAMASPFCTDIYLTRVLSPSVTCDEVLPAIANTFAKVEEDEPRTEGKWTFKHEHYRRGAAVRVIRRVTSRTANGNSTATSSGGSGGGTTTTTPTTTYTSSSSQNGGQQSGSSTRQRSKRSPRTRKTKPVTTTKTSSSKSSPRRPSRTRTRGSSRSSRSRSPRRSSPRRPNTTTLSGSRGKRSKQNTLMGKVQPVASRLDAVDETPGPGAYETEGSMGLQHSSYHPTASQWSFGAASRGAYHRQFLNKDLQDGVLNLNTQDVDYVNTSATGRQVLSTKPSMPSYSFGTAPRDQYHKEYLTKELAKGIQLKTTSNVEYMSPTDSTLSLGRFSKASQHTNSPRTTFGTSGRYLYTKQFIGKKFQHGIAKADEHMNTVEIPSNGTQVQSTKATAPSYGFGTSSRARQAKLGMLRPTRTQKQARAMKSPRLSPRVARESARQEVRVALNTSPVVVGRSGGGARLGGPVFATERAVTIKSSRKGKGRSYNTGGGRRTFTTTTTKRTNSSKRSPRRYTYGTARATASSAAKQSVIRPARPSSFTTTRTVQRHATDGAIDIWV